MATEEWSTDANEAVTVSVVRPGARTLQNAHVFHPKFTYPIFGEEERIFGYKGLEIDLTFASHDLRPNVHISYEKKFPAVGTTVALDLNKNLRDFLPSEAFVPRSTYDKCVQDDPTVGSFKPPGTLIQKYSRKGQNFEIWAGSLLDPSVRKIIDRIQILILLFIEAGTYLNTNDVDWTLERWKIYFVYEVLNTPEVGTSPYSFAGYATTYRFWKFQSSRTPKASRSLSAFPELKEISPVHLPSRLRISQFLILPPYQSSGHGSALYRAIYSEVITDQTIVELTLEDPSEECDRLRDINDWKVLEPQFREKNVKINLTPLPRIYRLPTSKLLPLDTLKAIQSSTKIANRQFHRQMEMYLLSLIPHSHRAAGGASLTKLLVQKARASNDDDKRYYWWRLILKQRITKKNKELLQQMDLAERLPQLEEGTRGQEDEYEGLLLYFATMAAKEVLLQNGNGDVPVRERKRKIVEDDDDDEADDEASEHPESEAKKMKA